MGNEPRDSDPGLAHYANHLAVAFTMLEFVLDFGQIYPGEELPILVSRVVASPGHFKAFARVMAETVEQYEIEYQRIPE